MDRREFLHQSTSLMIAGGVVGRMRLAHAETAPPKARVRIAMIGTSHPHATGKLTTIQELPDEFELVGIVEPDAKLQKSLASHPKYRGVRWLGEGEMLSSTGVQAVAVETAVRDLVPTAKRCVDAGLHVHLDKPAGESLAAFSHLLDNARQRNVHAQMGYMFRYSPAFEFCFRAVREKWLGKIFDVDGAISKKMNDKARQELAGYAGGTMFDLGAHLIDALVIVLGPPEKITPFGRSSHPERDSLIDNQLAVCEYPAALAEIRSSLVDPFGQEKRHFIVSGENGTIEINPLEPPQLQLSLEEPAGGFESGQRPIELPPSPGRYHKQLIEFASVVRGQQAPQWSADHDLSVHRAILQASNLPLDA